MSPARIVPALDEVEDRQAGLARGVEPVTIKQLTLKGREEALAQALSYASPTLPIDGRTPAARQRVPNATDVY